MSAMKKLIILMMMWFVLFFAITLDGEAAPDFDLPDSGNKTIRVTIDPENPGNTVLTIIDNAGSKVNTAAPVSSLPASERQALIDLYLALNGDNWTRNDNWRKPGDPTQFNDPGTEGTWYGVDCGLDGSHVVGLDLGSNNLSGPLPDISALTELEELYMYDNGLTGSIPASFNTMIGLKVIYLTDNHLSGAIPNLGNLSLLEDLHLYDNDLSGSIPASLNNLTGLKQLTLGANGFVGSPPNLGNLALLEVLYMNLNSLEGAVPSWLNQLTHLRVLDISYNNFTGALPNLGGLTGLDFLYINNCQLSGGVPSWLNGLTNLMYVSLAENNLTGEVPDLGNLIQLRLFDVAGNALTGSLPDLSQSPTLAYVYFYRNNFSGTIPSWVGNAGSLVVLIAYENNLGGFVPDLDNLSQLSHLALQDNDLTGMPDLYGLTNLQYLNLARNEFSGYLPGEFGSLTNLRALRVEGNMLRGPIPSGITNLTQLRSYDCSISYNRLYSDDPTVRAFLDSHFLGWESKQTVPPENLSITDVTDDSLVLHWDPILYQGNSGGYKIYYLSEHMSDYYLFRTVTDKSVDHYDIEGLLDPGTEYSYMIKSFTEPHGGNPNECLSDYSSVVSATTTGGATLTITAPDGGEIWAAESVQTITWTATGDITDVKLHYTTDNGINWHPITYSTPNDGSYDWTIPDDPSGWCRVKIMEVDGSVTDISDGMFTITPPPAPTITVTSPNGGESWKANKSQTITWTSTGSITNVDIGLSTDGGATYTTLAGGTPNDGSFVTTAPNQDAADCLIRITESGGTVYDVSDAVFSIYIPHTITITSPNGGENWQAGSTQTITWASTGNLGDLRVRYSTDGGANWVTIAVVNGVNSLSWTVPNTPSTNCLVRIREIGQYVVDNSDAAFTISEPPSITVTSPNGGESWPVGGNYIITWSSTGLGSNVDIFYSVNGGVNWTAVVYSTANDGQYIWNIPNTPSGNCFIKVKESGGVTEDISNGAFTIYVNQPDTLTVLDPNGGEVWTGGSVQTIIWTGTGSQSIVDIYYSLDNGVTWTMIASCAQNSGRYEWTTPVPGSTVTTCRVKVAYVTQNIYDISDAPFTLLGNREEK